MIKKDKVTFKYGVRTQIRVVEGYRDQDGKVKQKTIKTFGYLEDQPDQEAFMKLVKDYDQNYKKSKSIKTTKPTNAFFHLDPGSVEYNYGYRLLEAIYDKLEIDKFLDSIDTKAEYSLSEIFKFLVLQRILNPDSKRATYQSIQYFYNKFDDFSLQNIYRSLSKFDEVKVELQKHINDKIKKMIGRDPTYAFYDVTNYYFDIDFNDDDKYDEKGNLIEIALRKKGVSKEHQLSPIVQLGLFLDNNGIPINMSLFSGNTSDTKTLQPVMTEIKKNYGLNRLIIVADKGLNSIDNINFICNNKDGFVVSQTLRGKKGKRYHNHIFNDEDYVYNKDKTFKYKTFIEEYEGLDKDGKKVTRKRKVLIYWKYEDAIMALRKRNEKIDKAMKSLGNNAYAIKHSYEEYIKEIHSIKETGELADKSTKVINQEKVENDALFDGYFCIITSELEYDHNKIMEVYGGLWKIEETFRITKSELDARPVYVSTNEHIQGHFQICFVSLILLRMLQLKIKSNPMSVERIVRALNGCVCTIPEKGIIHLPRGSITREYKYVRNKKGESVSTLTLSEDDERIQDLLKILESYNVQPFFSNSYQSDFNNYLRSIKY
jgi:transposase